MRDSDIIFLQIRSMNIKEQSDRLNCQKVIYEFVNSNMNFHLKQIPFTFCYYVWEEREEGEWRIYSTIAVYLYINLPSFHRNSSTFSICQYVARRATTVYEVM